MMRIWLAAGALAACGDNVAAPVVEVDDPVALVDPTIGTGGLGFNYGSCFVGAAVPHGLAKPAPDTSSNEFGTIGFLHYSGYFAGDNRVQGFSQLHLHGTGATDYGVLSVMPALAFDPAKTSVVDYETAFDKADEHATAGRYDVTLANGIAVALTATPRVAVHRYTLPAPGAIVIDLAKTLDSGMVDDASITVDDAGEITGRLHHLGGMSRGFGGYTVYFVAHGSPWSSHWVWATGGAATHDATAQGAGAGAALEVPAGTFELAIGLSLVSLEGARANLAAELPAGGFDATANAARDAWANKLDVVRITGGTDVQQRIFYTSLYHAFLMPSVIDDADGSYQLVGQTAVQQAAGYHQMSDLSLWDTYRTVSSLYAWLAPDSARDTMRSLVGFGNGIGIYPKWPVAIGESGTMLGSSAEIVIADTVARGVAGVDGAEAYPMLRAAAMDMVSPPAGRGGRGDVVDYMQLGYAPRDDGRSVSLTTEYAHDDFALAQLAAAVGATADHDTLLARSHDWRNLYDPSVGFLRAKNRDGSFSSDAFDPTAMSDDYAEANAWQSLWMTGLHDPEGLAELLGGNDAAVDKLTEFFTNAKQDWDKADPAAANFPRPYYWHGNEPDLNAVYVFAQLGRPDLTQQWLRWVIDEMYTDQPDGIGGNDDGGTLGSWYVLSALGLYPISGSDGFVIGAPRFAKARVVVGGHQLAIVADNISDTAMYVQAVELDGVALDQPFVTQGQLAAATTLRFVMGDSPSSWGR